MTKSSRARGVADWASTFAIAAFFIWLAWGHWGPTLIGKIWPVMTPAQIELISAAPPPEWRNRWGVASTKLRNCEFLGIEWFAGPRGGRVVQVRAEFTGPPRVLLEGAHTWDGLVITLEADSVEHNSYADVIHKCGWGPFKHEVRTAWFDGTPEQEETE